MKVVKAKTARFASIIAACGDPQLYTLWQDPSKDVRFKKAIQENRIMTVLQQNVGSQKDFGIIGFRKEGNVSYLIFPKKLDDYEGKRIVGIDYNLIRVSRSRDPVRVSSKESKRAGKAKNRNGSPEKRFAEEISENPPKRFRIKARVVASIDVAREVEAPNQAEAKKKMKESLAAEKIDFSQGDRTVRISGIDELSRG